ncbi:MAG: hypothetical protein SPK11_08950 [Bullifex sp.]|nr:hypothetical protein [Bullifex sp.]
MRKKIISSLLMILISCSLFAASYYDNGSQRFTISAGISEPLSITRFADNENRTFSDTKLTPGGYGSICYQVNVHPQIALGCEIGYMFNFVYKELVTNVPMIFKATWLPVQGTVDIPISLGAGFSYLSLSDGGSYLPFYFSAEIGLQYYFTENWGLGINSGIWVIPEIYYSSAASSKNALATFIPATLAVTYRQ